METSEAQTCRFFIYLQSGGGFILVETLSAKNAETALSEWNRTQSQRKTPVTIMVTSINCGEKVPQEKIEPHFLHKYIGT
jgi:hypothetical protein